MTKVAFIGLGNMGAPMAENLIEAGYTVCGYDLIPEALERHQAIGGIAAKSIDQAVAEVDVVISMLPAGAHVESLYLGDNGLLSILPEKSLIIECSTIEADIAKKVAVAASERKMDFIDAPVSGGTAGAAAGTLTFMVGGKEKGLVRARPYLDVMGQAVFHAGDFGAGQLAKMCNNMLLAVLMTGTSEALKLGMDNGLDPTVLSEIMKSSSGGNWVLEKYNPVPGVMENTPASNHYQGGFMVGLMAKDLGLALGAAAASKTPVPLSSMAENLYRLHAQQNGLQLDFSSIYQFYSKAEAS